MSVNIDSIDLTTLTVFKRELQSIEALNQNVSPDVIEYLTQRIAEIESPLPPKPQQPLLKLPLNKQEMPSKIDPPCIGICTLNKDGVCIGCNRTVKEIHNAYLESIGMKK